MEMLNMQINTWFGGVGVGWMNYYTFIIIAVFISGLMVGRTPEFLGKKVEAREMKIATIVALLHPFVILVFTAISSYIYVHHPDFVESEGGWLNNLGFHGLSEQLYEYTSCAANNGSGFEGLGDNTLLRLPITVLVSRVWVIILISGTGPVVLYLFLADSCLLSDKLPLPACWLRRSSFPRVPEH